MHKNKNDKKNLVIKNHNGFYRKFPKVISDKQSTISELTTLYSWCRRVSKVTPNKSLIIFTIPELKSIFLCPVYLYVF